MIVMKEFVSLTMVGKQMLRQEKDSFLVIIAMVAKRKNASWKT